MKQYQMATKVCVVCHKKYECYAHDSETQRYCSHKCYGDTLKSDIPKDELYNLYYVDNLSTRKIGEHFNVSKTTISRAMKRYGFEPYKGSQTMKGEHYKKPLEAELRRLYWELWLPYEEIAKIYNVSSSAVYRWFVSYGLPTREGHETRNGRDFVYPTKEELERYYIDEEMTTAEIGEMYKIGKNTISAKLKEFDIPIRPNLFNGASFKTCKDGHIVRSNYEKVFDNILYKNGIEHEYEVRLPFDKRFACDFKVNDVYVEIWGVENNQKYTERTERKIKLYQKHNAKLLSIYPNDFKNINSKIEELKRLID